MQAIKYFDTKGVDELMEVEYSTIQRKLKNIKNDKKSMEFLKQLEEATTKAIEIGEKWSKRIQERALSWYPGYEFDYHTVKYNHGYRFYFKIAPHPDYCI